MLTRPDNSVYPSTVVSSDVDLAELAARLGSPSRIRRSGRVVLLDNFISSAGWEISVSGAGGCNIYSEYEHLHPFTPPGMLVMESGAGGGSSGIKTTYPCVSTSVIGAELVYMWDIGTSMVRFTMQINANLKWYRLWFNNTNRKWNITTDGGEVEIGEDGRLTGWLNLKLVFNQQTGKFISLEVNKTHWDLNAYTAPSSMLESYNIELSQYLYTDPNSAGIFIDSFVLTTDESVRQ